MAIKLKRGTTADWALGPELVYFENSPVASKDSVYRAEGTELEMYVFTESKNEWYVDNPSLGDDAKTDGKIYGLPIELNIDYDPTKHYKLCVDYEGFEDYATLEMIGWDGQLVTHNYLRNGPYIDEDYCYSEPPKLFMKWEPERVGVQKPTLVKIRVSMREISDYEELEEGQLGLEYTGNGKVRLKAGMPNISKWNELPYIGGNDKDDVTVVALSQYYSASLKLNEGFGTCIVVHDYPEYDENFTPDDDIGQNGHTCLVFDMGNDQGRTLRQYLEEKQIPKIDALYISHFHWDHYQPQAIANLVEAVDEKGNSLGANAKKIPIKQIVLPHGGLDYNYLKNNKNTIKSYTDIDGQIQNNTSTLEQLIQYTQLPLIGIQDLVNKDADEALLGAGYHDQLAIELQQWKDRGGDNEIQYQYLYYNNSSQSYGQGLLNKYKALIENNEMNILQPCLEEGQTYTHGQFDVECYNITNTVFENNGYFNWYYNEWLNPLLRRNVLTTMEYLTQLDKAWAWGEADPDGIYSSKSDYIQGIFHWAEADEDTWRVWSEYWPVWTNTTYNSWAEFIQSLLNNNKGDDGQPSIVKIGNYIKCRIDNSPAASSFFDTSRLDDSADNENRDNPDMVDEYGLSLQFYQQLYSSMIAQEEGRYIAANYNNFSMINVVNIHGKRIVITGDIMYPAIKANLKHLQEADIIMVPHHGLDTSFPQEAIDKLHANYAVISSAYDASKAFSMQRVSHAFAGELIKNGCTVTSTFSKWYPYFNDENIDGLDDEFMSGMGRYTHVLLEEKELFFQYLEKETVNVSGTELKVKIPGEQDKDGEGNLLREKLMSQLKTYFSASSLAGKRNRSVVIMCSILLPLEEGSVDSNTHRAMRLALNKALDNALIELFDSNPNINKDKNQQEHTIFKITPSNIVLENATGYAGKASYPITLHPGMNSTMYRDGTGDKRGMPYFGEEAMPKTPKKYRRLTDDTFVTLYGYGDEYGYFSYAWPYFYKNSPKISNPENLDNLKIGNYISYSGIHASRFDLPFSYEGRKFKLEVEPVSATGLAKTQRAYQVNTSAKVEELTRTQASDTGRYEPWRSFKQNIIHLDKLKNEVTSMSELPVFNDYYVFSNETQLEDALNKMLDEVYPATLGTPYIKKFTFKILDIGGLRRDVINPSHSEQNPTLEIDWTWTAELTRTGTHWAVLTATCGYQYGTTIQKRCVDLSITDPVNYKQPTRKWDPIEFINPTLCHGIEYRTAERLFTHPVYVKAFELKNSKDIEELIWKDENTSTHTISNIEYCQFYLPLGKNIQITRIEIYRNGLPDYQNVNTLISTTGPTFSYQGYEWHYNKYGSDGQKLSAIYNESKTMEKDTVKLQCTIEAELIEDPDKIGINNTYVKVYYYYK